MKITIVGTGYVGLSNAILLAQYNEATSNVVFGKQCHLDKHTLILKEKSRKCYKAIKA